MIALSTTTTAEAALPPVATYVECGMCAFEPAEQLLLPRGPCPKCHSNVWQRSVRPGTLLRASASYQPERPGHAEGDESVIGLAHHGPAPL